MSTTEYFIHRNYASQVVSDNSTSIDTMETDDNEQLHESVMEQHEKDVQRVHEMLDACQHGPVDRVQRILIQHGEMYARWQDDTTGQSPLMVASAYGHLDIVQALLEHGAPWNAIDRNGLCAGDYATQHERWDVVQTFVEHATRCELILAVIERNRRNSSREGDYSTLGAVSDATKPDFLQHPLKYSHDRQALLDADSDAVMMEWERPIMKAHAEVLMKQQNHSHQQPNSQLGKRILNVGFGMGIIDGFIQEMAPSHHIIIEAHPDVHRHMIEKGWGQKQNVRICFGKWQIVLPQLIAEGIVVDAIFFDTYGEHFLDLEDFQTLMVQLLAKPHGMYSFFNGLAPDNLFFHGVACQCVKLQLGALGLDSEFWPCQIQVPDTETWKGIRRQYWHNRDTYYLPVVTWNAEYLATGKTCQQLQTILESATNQPKRKVLHQEENMNQKIKRQQQQERPNEV